LSHRTLTIHGDNHTSHAPTVAARACHIWFRSLRVNIPFTETPQSPLTPRSLLLHRLVTMASLEQQLQALMHQQQQQETNLQLLAQQNQHLQQQLAQHAQVLPPQPQAGAAAHEHSPGGRRHDRPRLPPPKKFDGRSTTLDAWETECLQQFEWYDMADDVERVKFAVAFTEGAAYDWWQHMQPVDRQALQTFTLLVAALRKRFQPVTTADSARAAITVITQGKSTVHAYTMAFRRLLTPLDDMGEADRLFHFLRGLKPSIAVTVRTHGVDTLDKAIAMAARVGSQGEFAAIANAGAAAASGSSPMDLDALNAVEGLEKETTAGSSSSSPPNASGSADGPGPATAQQFQELLAMMRNMRRGPPSSSSKPRLARDSEGRVKYGSLSREEMDSRFARNACFHCNKTGHRAAQCKTAQKEGDQQKK
jgi:hypothetical protein